jgi:hypothetical protein
MDARGSRKEWEELSSAAERGAVREHASTDVSASPDLVPPSNEDLALALLSRRDLPAETLEQLSQNPAAMKSRKVCVALAVHHRTPRHLVLRLLRQLYTFDLMRLALHPAFAADLKRLADDQLVARLASVTLGERLTLSRRGSQTVAAVLLLDKEPRVSHTALENSRLTESAVIKALLRPNARAAFVEAVCHHPKWSVRREIRMTLLRSRHTPLACALEFARTMPPPLLRDILHASRLPEKIKIYLRNTLKERT